MAKMIGQQSQTHGIPSKKYIHINIIFNVESTSIILHANKKDPILYLHEYFLNLIYFLPAIRYSPT